MGDKYSVETYISFLGRRGVRIVELKNGCYRVLVKKVNATTQELIIMMEALTKASEKWR